MKNPVLNAEKRTVLGKKVRNLRRDGLIPANVYGKNIPSVALQVKADSFQAIYKEVGETGLIDLTVDGESRPALIKNLQMNYREQIPLHVDFYQVNLKEKVKTMVPLEVIGEAAAVTEKIGMLMQPISEVEVEALPADLPEKIEVNVEKLSAVDEQITVADLHVPSDVAVLTDPTQIVVKVAELVSKEAEEEAAAEAAAAEEAAAEGAAAEGEKAEGETPEGEEKSEEKTDEKES